MNYRLAEDIHTYKHMRATHAHTYKNAFSNAYTRKQVEYKWKLVHKTADRVTELITQMNYRLAEGRGEAVYELGIHDDGRPEGLTGTFEYFCLSVFECVCMCVYVCVSICAL